MHNPNSHEFHSIESTNSQLKAEMENVNKELALIGVRHFSLTNILEKGPNA
jgi:hypothetical protein